MPTLRGGIIRVMCTDAVENTVAAAIRKKKDLYLKHIKQWEKIKDHYSDYICTCKYMKEECGIEIAT